MAFTEVRLTLGAFIQALEKDLKVLINQYITPFQSSIDFFQDKHLQERVLERIKKDEETFAEGASIEELVDYLDFGDTFVILRKNKLFLPERLARFLDQNIIHFNAIIPIRNRVMHTRPLLNGDFNTVYDFISTLESNDTTHWRSIVRTRTEINKDPNSVLTLTIPALELLEDSSPVQHNLPIPDFDETGFIGREDDVRAIIQLISSTPVVTILGDGGIGKSALCLKVAYDLVDLKDQCPFELVIWTTAKSTMLTSQGIQEISSAIKNYAGLVEDISKTLEIESADENQLDEILEYLETFKVLLIIDNLETIHSNEVRDFIRKAQTKCKILITSRIRMGELEYPRRLDGLTSNECARLVRSMAKTRNSDILKKLPNSVLAEVSQQLYFNPLALKWFVNSVENGVPPNEVLLHRDDLLNFCLTNVYDKLSEDARVVLNVIRASRRKMSVGEIIFLSQMRPILIKTLLVELMKTTLIHRHIKDIKSFKEIQYSISDFAKDFLSRNYRIDTDYIRMHTARHLVYAGRLNATA